jgi:arylsulfatase A-like enzyme
MKYFTFLLALLLGPLDALHSAETSAKKPNVIVIVVDDLGYGDVSCLTNGAVKTPNIDRLAKTGVKFTSGYVTAPLCGPSRAAIFSGIYGQRFGFVDNEGGIPAGQTLFPGALRAAGYRTTLLGKWHSSGPMPHERGCFDETLCSHVSNPFIDYHHPKLARNGNVAVSDEYSTNLFAREAVEFIERNKAQLFSLTVTFNAPHILRVVKPFHVIRKEYEETQAAGKVFDIPKKPMARPGEAAKYADQFPGDNARADTVATIAALDEAVGRILDKLQATDLDRKTVVFFVGDNGGHPENRSENLPLRDYKWSFYEGGIRVPFLVSYPGVFPAGVEYSKPVSSLDIFPTIAALTGIKLPAGLDGVNLTSFVNGDNVASPHEALYFSMNGAGAVRQEQWKLVLARNGASQLFNLSKDVSEKHDLAPREPERVKELTQKWQAWHAQMPAITPKGKDKNAE